MVLKSPLPNVTDIPEEPLGQYLMRAMESHGDAVAIVDMQNKKQLTFSQIKDQALAYTNILKEAGLRKGDIVGLVMPYDLQYAALLLAVVNCGAIIFGTKLLYKASILKQLGKIKPILTIIENDRYKEISENLKRHVPSVRVCLGFGQLEELKPNSIRSEDECLEIKEEFNVRKDPVVIFQSSGTTGEPKGIVTTHYGTIALIEALKSTPPGPSSGQIVVGAVLNIIHVFSLGSFFAAIANGIKSVYTSAISVPEFFEFVDQYKINSFIVTNTNFLKQLAESEIPPEYDISSLKYVSLGTTSYPTHLIRQAREKFKIPFSMGYGMTECPVIASSAFPGTPIDSVGKPYSNVKVRIVEVTSGKELEANNKGEIQVQSTHAMKGYYLKEEEKESKTDDWICTGDIGYYDENGFLYVVGRIKDIIKIQPGNVTVLPAELEAILVRHEKISEVAVVGVPHPDHGEVPKAFVVRKDLSLTKEEILQFFNSETESLAPLDGGIEFMESLPRTELGKILRRELLVQHTKN